MVRIGIRHEDKSTWEARTPLVPEAVRRLIAEHGLEFTVQRSPVRAFAEDQYEAAGASIADDLDDCPIVMGVKEVPPDLLEAGITYVYFSHTIKGQAENMPALRRLMELGCTLIDYERITDADGRRLVFFSRFAGIAGMIDTVWALGRRLAHEGVDSPFQAIQPAHTYMDVEHARAEIRAVGERIKKDGLPAALRPFVCGFAGYGQVSQGAQEIYDFLPVKEIDPAELGSIEPAGDVCYKVVFREEHMVRRQDASSPFYLDEYFNHPDRYCADFFPHVEHLTLLVNGIFWTRDYPQFITRDHFRQLYEGREPRLRVIGDITCDVDGALACTVRSTEPDSPIYVYDPVAHSAEDGVVGHGPVVLAVDFLPCEVPVDASNAFSEALLPFVPALAAADFAGSLADSGLPDELKRATMLWRGELTEPFQYLREYLAQG